MNICSYFNLMRDTVRIFKALSDSTRLRIMMLLLKRELCVCELSFILKMEQSRISHQLRILRDADLVEDIRDKQWIIYRIPDSVRKNQGFFFKEFIKERLKNSKDIKDDLKNLEICLEEEIKKRNK
jgi:ArsR family transcriptional regulator